MLETRFCCPPKGKREYRKDRPSNLERFLEATKPFVHAQYLPKTMMKSIGTRDGESRPCFSLRDLWESFKEWSAYGVGVPLVLNEGKSVVQYYVPYLSGIQLYVESMNPAIGTRRTSEDSDGDYSWDSSSDCEPERTFKISSESKRHYDAGESALMMGDLSLEGSQTESLEGFSSDDSEASYPRARLWFEFFEREPPYCRVPLADKISHLASHFPDLTNLWSCDLSPASWMSVAWYPIYRIPTGPTICDLDACFLTFHSLSTPLGDTGTIPGSPVTYSQSTECVPEIYLPVFGLASYKMKGSIWIPSEGHERQYTDSLLQAADSWLRLRRADHPDYQFFVSRGAQRR